MKSFQFKSLLLLAALIISLPSFGQGLKAFKLKNGLSVYIWEDESKSDVFGLVGVRAGSINDPEEYTGLAHYLEHVMFKGTDKIGARKSSPSTTRWPKKPTRQKKKPSARKSMS